MSNKTTLANGQEIESLTEQVKYLRIHSAFLDASILSTEEIERIKKRGEAEGAYNITHQDNILTLIFPTKSATLRFAKAL